MSDAPELVWITFARPDNRRDPQDKGSGSYIGDANDGQTEDNDTEYVRADLPGWQDISTAPKDGSPVLVWADSHGWRGKFARMSAVFHQGQWRIFGPILGEPDASGGTRQWLGEVTPTHWMPLPKPPE